LLKKLNIIVKISFFFSFFFNYAKDLYTFFDLRADYNDFFDNKGFIGYFKLYFSIKKESLL